MLRSLRSSNLQVAVPIVAGLLILFIAIFARLMNYDLRRDEHMYVPPALLLEQYRLYADIFYNHVPGSAWLFYIAKAVVGSDQLLLSARLAVFAAWLFFAWAVGWITFRLTQSLAMTAFSVLLFLTNDALLTVTGMAATNNFLPLPLAYLGLGLFILGVQNDRSRILLIALGGVALSLAASIKLSAFAFIPPVAVAAFLLPYQEPFPTRLRSVVLPLALGGVLGALPVLFYFAADPERFIAHVVAYHTGPHVAYWDAQSSKAAEVALSSVDKAKLAYLIWTSGANIILAFAMIYFVMLLSQGQSLSGFLRRVLTGPILVVAAGFVLVLLMSFVPTPSFPQYFAPPLVCAGLLLTLLYARIDEDGRRRALPMLVAASLVLLIVNLPRLTQHLGRLPDPGAWTVTKIHRNGLAIAERLADAEVVGKVATLSPVYPLEANLPVYPELATGQFAYRVADVIDPELEEHYRMTSPATIEALLEADPPAALLLGFEPELEVPMVRYAESHGYRRIDDLGLVDRYGRGVLYVRPFQSRE